MLLVFAHRGEAQLFFENHKLKEHPAFSKLYYNSEFHLLLCGEGKENSLLNTTRAIAILNNKINLVINYGIAGALEPTVPLNKIITSRTIYTEKESEMKFHSFQDDKKSKYDLITTNKRILNDSNIETFKNFGHIVDREAWAIFMSSKSFKKEVKSFKLISDYTTHEKQDFCKSVQEHSIEFSNKFYEHFELNFLNKIEKENEKNLQLNLESFHVTFSQKEFIKNNYPKISENHKEFIKKYIKELIGNQDISKKAKTKNLIIAIEQKLKPLTFKLQENIDQLLNEFQNGNIKFQYDKKLEKTELKLTATIENKTNIDTLITYLEQLPFEKFQNILNGEY